MKQVDFSKTVITGGIWKEKQQMVRKTTVKAVYDRFKETGRFDAFKCNWKEGMPNKPHIFWDSDVAKWMEGAAYLTQMKREPRLEKIIDNVVDEIEKNRMDDGYFNSYYITCEPQNRFTEIRNHELYCAGHLIEAAVAYYNATGKKKLLDIMCKYADYIERRFKTEYNAGFHYPGHPELELALVKLYDCTGEKRYLELSDFFLTERNKGNKPEAAYNGSSPVREMKDAVGHCVRATYLYSGMADVAMRTGDKELLKACNTLFDDIVNGKMYITGGIGSTCAGEAFTVPYNLPNMLAYTETCAAIGLAFFAQRMLLIENNSKYSDTIERIIYNGFLSSVSLDGKRFFYENPLETVPYIKNRDGGSIHLPITERVELFNCSCCPPNIVRFIPSIANYIYTTDSNTVYVHQYMQSKTGLDNGLHIEQKTRYPENGKVSITVTGGNTRLAVRIPWWCENNKLPTVKGYAFFDVKDGETIKLDFGMPTRFIEANPRCYDNNGKCAVMRGPVLYCLEAVDNGSNIHDIRLDRNSRFQYGKDAALGVPTLSVRGYRTKGFEELYRSAKKPEYEKISVKLIPYYAFANRGETEMQVWSFVK